jgi:hypothetical protein
MIKTNQKKSRLELISTMLIVAPYESTEGIKQLQNLIKLTFPSTIKFDFLFIKEKFNKDEVLFQGTNVFYCSKNDYSLFGRIKNKEIKPLQSNVDYDALLCSCFHFNKLVKKTLNTIKNKLTIGVDQNGMYNFDIGFMINDKSDKRLAEQAVKYLKQL